VIIGREATRVSEKDALSYVRGYTVANDVSARDLQFADVQWVRAKSLDTFCPLGPKVVELDDPQNLRLQTRVNGETMQDSNTDQMIFGVAELISYCSHSFRLEPGDLILTGTPWGVGEFMDPKRSLQDGDVVECEIEGIGVLRNPVVDV
jgi:5-carboxymethyl-2-hydroxymuconate isomerase